MAKPLLRSFLATFLMVGILPINKAYSAHILGGSMHYRCLGSNDYAFRLILFRDCFSGGAAFDSDFNSGAPFAGTVTVYIGNNTTPHETIELPAPIIESLNEPLGCFNQPNICLEKGTYNFNLDFNGISNDLPIHVVYQRCCSTANIVNVLNPGETGITCNITLTPQARLACNSSPIMNGPYMVCSAVNQPLLFDHGFSDINGDSLSYAFCAPYAGGGNDQINATAPNGVAPDPDMPPPYTEINFNTLYSPDMPILGNPAPSIDALTGTVSGTPSALGLFIYGVCVQEFRDGQILSETRFEFGHSVLNSVSALKEHSLPAKIEVWPNPSAVNGVTVKLPFVPQGKSRVQLQDFNGRPVQVQQTIQGNEIHLGWNGLPTGLYLLKLEAEGQYHWIKIAIED